MIKFNNIEWQEKLRQHGAIPVTILAVLDAVVQFCHGDG